MIQVGNTKRMKGFSLANGEGCAPGHVKSTRDRQELKITIVGTCCHAYGDKESRSPIDLLFKEMSLLVSLYFAADSS